MTLHNSEWAEQREFMSWCAIMAEMGTYPELRLMYSIVNENRGSRIAGSRAKQQGQKAGMPDLCLPVARGEYHALYLELKVGKNKPSKKQKERIALLRSAGNCVKVCYGWDQLREETERYLALPAFTTVAGGR